MENQGNLDSIEDKKVIYFHLRYARQFGKQVKPQKPQILLDNVFKPSQKGGITIACCITDVNGLVVAQSNCSVEDMYNKQVGKEIAYNRLKDCLTKGNCGSNLTVISSSTIYDYIDSNVTLFNINKKLANKIKQTLTIHDLSLVAIRNLVINQIGL